MNDKSPDRITQEIGVLKRRETEARIIAPIIDALSDSFGKEAVLEVIKDKIISLSRQQGISLAKEYGKDVDAFLKTLEFWTQDNALEIDIIEKDENTLNFNVVRCKYAEMYDALGIKELGATLSCNRDYALIEGFNSEATLTREKTIMSGNDCCTFRYNFGSKE
tara:strand:+ start:1414 stop:1905 length:492 start_codon:yes stop_codon:yes gene_type:complete